MQYQSFDNAVGNSDSPAKLKRLRLPRSLANKSVLDLGCNLGFFCGEALRRGAAHVVGVDHNSEAIQAARNRFPNIEFACRDWLEAPHGPFDIILLLSALHYASDPEELILAVRKRLKPKGLFVFELGVVVGGHAPWIDVMRTHDTVRHPSHEHLMHHLLSDFAPRLIGRSIDQPGDPTPRFVYHCKHFVPILVVVSGRSGAGKSILARELGHVTHVSSDRLLSQLGIPGDQIGATLKRLPEAELNRLGRHVAEVILSRPARLTVIDGFAFTIDHFRAEFVSRIGPERKTWFCETDDFAEIIPPVLDPVISSAQT